MKIALIGGTGFIGSHILKELLDRGHEITSISRKADKIEHKNNKLKVVNIDVNDTDNLARALRNNQIVISAFNAGWDNPNLYDDHTNGCESIQMATRAANIRRYFVVGNAGSLFNGSTQLVDTDNFPAEMKDGAKASRDHFEKLRRETYLDWVYLSPPMEIDKNTTTGRTNKFRTGKDEPVVKEGVSSISVQDLAIAIADEVEDRKYSRQQFTVGY